MKTANTISIIISAFLLAALIASPASGESYLHIGFGESASVYTISVIGDNLFYKDQFFRGVLPESEDYIISLYDNQANTLQEYRAYLDENNIYPFQAEISRITIYEGNTLISVRQLSFCNYNMVCEPCYGPDCTLIENSLTCTDCLTGSSDYTCDLARDGICDPDCSGKDADCPGCEPDCWYTDSMQITTTCATDKGGIACAPGQLCTGEFTYADDTGSLCCTGGTCMEKEVYVEPKQTTTTETPSRPEKSGSSADDEKTLVQKSNNPPIWIIPFAAVIIIIVLALLLLRKPDPYR